MGALVGCVAGSNVGDMDGFTEGSSVGDIVGSAVGRNIGDRVEWKAGTFVGISFGLLWFCGGNTEVDFTVGCMVELGYEVAPFASGFNEGDLVEVNVGEPNEGDCEGSSVGLVDGSSVGLTVGRRELGCRVGFLEG